MKLCQKDISILNTRYNALQTDYKLKSTICTSSE